MQGDEVNTKEGMELNTVMDFIRWCFSLFNQSDLYYGHGTTNAWDEAVALVLDSLALPSDVDKSLLNGRLTTSEKQRLCRVLDGRINRRQPLAYLTNRIQFAGIEFYIDERALIPRSPIAELIEQQFSPWLAQPPMKVLDMCTGGGCIALATAIYHPEAMVDGVDISHDALAVARLNMERLELDNQVRFIESDLYQAIPGETYDLIVTNPPYVDAQDMATIPEEYRHEPEMALASGEDGLDCARQILAGAAQHLNEGGVLIMEVGNSAPALEAAFPTVSFIWLEFERGGGGVCLLERAELLKIAS
jgi:ribosomal protein L3 glutamine methyltransferase